MRSPEALAADRFSSDRGRDRSAPTVARSEDGKRQARLLLRPPAMKRSVLAGAMLSLMMLGGAPAPRAFADGRSQSEVSCPAYRSHLLEARASLTRGDRVGAIFALRQAREALRACSEAMRGDTRLASRGRDLGD